MQDRPKTMSFAKVMQMMRTTTAAQPNGIDIEQDFLPITSLFPDEILIMIVKHLPLKELLRLVLLQKAWASVCLSPEVLKHHHLMWVDAKKIYYFISDFVNIKRSMITNRVQKPKLVELLASWRRNPPFICDNQEYAKVLASEKFRDIHGEIIASRFFQPCKLKITEDHLVRNLSIDPHAHCLFSPPSTKDVMLVVEQEKKPELTK